VNTACVQTNSLDFILGFEEGFSTQRRINGADIHASSFVLLRRTAWRLVCPVLIEALVHGDQPEWECVAAVAECAPLPRVEMGAASTSGLEMLRDSQLVSSTLLRAIARFACRIPFAQMQRKPLFLFCIGRSIDCCF